MLVCATGSRLLTGRPLWAGRCRSVPSGRVGNNKDAIFRSNEHFREAVAEREAVDVAGAAVWL